MEENYYIKGYLDYDFHCEKIGKLVEVLENHLRNQVEEIGIKKSSEILLRMRSTAIIGKTNNEQSTRLYDIFQEKFRALQMTK